MPRVKPEIARKPSSVPRSKLIYHELVCYGAVRLTAGLEIEWVDSLSLHLDLDASRRTLKLFRFPSYCRMMYHERNMHRQYLTPSRIESSSC